MQFQIWWHSMHLWNHNLSNLNKHKKRVHEKIAIPPNFACSSCVQNIMGCIFMTPLHCLFALSLFSGWVFSFKGRVLLRTTLCAFSSFGKGKIIAHNLGTKIGLISHIYFGIFCTGWLMSLPYLAFFGPKSRCWDCPCKWPTMTKIRGT